MEALEGDVTGPICVLRFAHADMHYTFCNIPNGGGPNFD